MNSTTRLPRPSTNLELLLDVILDFLTATPLFVCGPNFLLHNGDGKGGNKRAKSQHSERGIQEEVVETPSHTFMASSWRARSSSASA